MIYAFTEAEKKQVESRGMMVIEFKRNLKMIESVSKAVSKAWEELLKLAEAIGKACYEFCKKFNEAVDDIRVKYIQWRNGAIY